MSQEEIDRMLEEAERFKSEDDTNKNRIEAKNGLEKYYHYLKTTVDSEEIKDTIPESDKEKVLDKMEETIRYLLHTRAPKLKCTKANRKYWKGWHFLSCKR